MRLRKVHDYSIMGPYPLPSSYTPHVPLSEDGWKLFAERSVRSDLDFVLGLLKENQRVLDIGSGYGKIPLEVGSRTGKAYSLEPDPDRLAIQRRNIEKRGVEIAQGSAESIPFPDRHFDAVISVFVLHFVADLDKALCEMIRVTDPTAPNTQIVVVQGAPDSEVFRLMNEACAPLSVSNPWPNHQGYLLDRAARVFAQHGFGDISIYRVDAFSVFEEEELQQRCKRAAEAIAGLWCWRDENFGGMVEALVPEVKGYFDDHPNWIMDQKVALVARPGNH
ncbi:S-adenosyl-L-methionine-dependent methyltransferase [Aspergillus ellipticus CBS 707.79]|uniref:S-adenosyl-L-methionine-dependent methyltransferase n=1 Tax=Aspergillus ellipticus CBS 707.79 TaxID=1448320 RepID=A0A319D548_9EURO|nr:S-adenosyl-L-methionine-dependent methyltransferase [Aspergillus ellipticus CBS 707.79]